MKHYKNYLIKVYVLHLVDFIYLSYSIKYNNKLVNSEDEMQEIHVNIISSLE